MYSPLPTCGRGSPRISCSLCSCTSLTVGLRHSPCLSFRATRDDSVAPNFPPCVARLDSAPATASHFAPTVAEPLSSAVSQGTVHPTRHQLLHTLFLIQRRSWPKVHSRCRNASREQSRASNQHGVHAGKRIADTEGVIHAVAVEVKVVRHVEQHTTRNNRRHVPCQQHTLAALSISVIKLSNGEGALSNFLRLPPSAHLFERQPAFVTTTDFSIVPPSPAS